MQATGHKEKQYNMCRRINAKPSLLWTSSSKNAHSGPRINDVRGPHEGQARSVVTTGSWLTTHIYHFKRRLSNLPMQGTWVRLLVWEDSTCNWAHAPQLLKPEHPRAQAPNKRRSHHDENPAHRNTAARELPLLTTTKESLWSTEDPGQP